MKRSLIAILGLIILASCHPKAKQWTVMNYDQTLAFHLILEKSKLYYSIDFLRDSVNKIQAIEKSPMGLVRSDRAFLDELSFLSESESKVFVEDYEMYTGKQKRIYQVGISKSFSFLNKEGAILQIDVKVLDDGAAFRYVFPDSSSTAVNITQEHTGFNIPEKGFAWMLPYSKVDNWSPAYEAEWQNHINIGSSSPDSVGWCFPALFNTNDLWVMITESGLDSTCFGIHLAPHAPGGHYKSRLPEWNETYGVAPQHAEIMRPWKSAWRTFIIGENPGAIMQSNLVHTLSASPASGDNTWIRPGRVSWSWWSDHNSPSYYDRLTPFIDLSAQLGWEYSLIDANWHQMQGGDIQKLIRYANKKNVGLILWYNSGGDHNQVKDACPCDIMQDRSLRRAEMKKLQDWGIKGIKVDFLQSDKQYIIKLYQDILRDAADFKLMVDFHGATVPRGWQRTFPNLLTMEGIRGAEQYWDTNFAENAHMFHTIYAFTRNVVGSMDYTPVILGDALPNIPHRTTNAHELALAVIFESGLQHFADKVENFNKQSQEVLNYLRNVPVSWDETHYIAGKPGEWVVLARRSGNDWHIAGINGQAEENSISFRTDFLSEGNWEGKFIADGKSQEEYAFSDIVTGPQDVLTFVMAGRGGFCGIVYPSSAK